MVSVLVSCPGLKKITKSFLLLLVILLAGGTISCSAEDNAYASQVTYLSFLFGNFRGPDRFNNAKRSSGWDIDNGLFLGMGFGGELSRYCLLEMELGGWNSSFDANSAQGTGSYTITSDTYMNFVFKLTYPLEAVRPYVGAAYGLYESRLSPKDSVASNENAWAWGEQLLAGVDVMILRRHSLGVEFRKTFLRVDFGNNTGGEQELGGEALALVYRYWYR